MPLPKPLTAEAGEVGAAIFRAAEVARRDVVYVRPVWGLVMLMIRTIPERVFKRMKL